MNEMNNEVQIVNYEPQYKEAFKALNEKWIKTFFTMEAGDYKLLDNPQEYIVDKGGYIIVALLNGEAVGTCALVKISDEPLRFELSKMAVSPKAQGKKIGYLVGQALVEKARALNAESIFLETNSVLLPAIKLYEKLGFDHMPVSDSAYTRCDTQMLLKFND
ncbi:GNAT family N-acetyltransferase [Chryseobacterium carnipullorum]|uniref:GNAT family N-acetyltransferase n=1 Tax=Chryseobacterium carnipullorum TaxID=1124835 RepID=A0A376ESY5_CHRCU|nr:GNAT family N-acetyltransferase [Chryseobacterium carnipullorum]AZA47912.1 GNAT family N-acetyltransferase [Chryseobacterium carnipullorum]AZA67231.1 GNAT family N-acetyltransferase [Chryseobacterium carnipullorum]STD12723.1 ribosomal-protein-alanine acetyltransferase [Chryseobacterium carnipullorum]